MKKTVLLCVFLFVFALLLCGCVSDPELQNNNTTGSAEDIISGSNNETLEHDTSSMTDTEASESSLDTSGQEEPVILNTAEDFWELVKNNHWYGKALGCIFEKPEEIPAKFYFYNGVGAKEEATGDELAFIIDAYKKKNPGYRETNAFSYMRLPVAKMNEALSILGVTVEDLQIPEHWVYYDKLDAYYFWVRDAYGVQGSSVTKVEKGEDGIVKIYWETKSSIWGTATGEPLRPSDGDPLKMVYTMQLQPDGTYRVLSNLPQE